MPLKIYADANAFIRGVEGDDPSAILVRRILAAEGGSIVSSELTLAEVLVGPMKLHRADPGDRRARTWRASYDALFDKVGALEAAPVSNILLRDAAERRAEHGYLRLPDAIHLATAVACQCQVMLSDDKNLCRAAASHMQASRLTVADLDALLARVDAAP